MSHSHAHSHSHGGSDRWFDFPLDHVGRRLAVVVVALLIGTVVGLILLWPSGGGEVPQILVGSGVDRLDVTVDAVEPTDCIGAPDSPVECVEVVFGVGEGRTGSFVQTPSVTTPDIEAGDRIVVADQGTVVEERFRYFFLDFQRERSLTVLVVLFVAAILILGRWQGLRSLVALFLGFVVLIVFTLPALLESSPVFVAIVGSVVVAILTLYLTHGVTHLTTVALIGSVASLSVTGAFAWIFVRAATLTGFSDEEALFLASATGDVDLPGVLLAGMIIGTIGILDDVTVTQASVVSELRDADPSMSATALYASAMNVGRDHIGSTTNTLAFAYAGAALPLLLLFTQAQLSLHTVLTSEVVAIELIQALVGALGLISSVPITTGLAVWAARSGHLPQHTPDHGH